jgi:choline transport protein
MKVHPVWEVPVNALLLTGMFVTVSTQSSSYSPTDPNHVQVYGTIFIGSTTAFAAMVSATIIFLQTSCVIPQLIVLYRGRDRVLPPRHFNLGRLGAPINAISVAWVIFLDVLYCFPTTMPVTAENMSYVSVVSVGLVCFVIGLWFLTKRKTFLGPKINLDLLHARRLDALGEHDQVEEVTSYQSNDVKH